MKTAVVFVVILAAFWVSANAIDCYRCQYTKSDSGVVQSGLEQALVTLGETNDATCPDMLDDNNVSTCDDAGASCGTVQATLELAVEFGGSVVSVTLNVFSRDCFPDVTNPGIDAEDVANGCQDAENFQEFFENRFMQGLTILRGMTAQLNDIGGTICFCNDKDKCNDCKLLEENKCVGNGAGNVAFVHYHLMFMAASLSTWCAQ